MVDEHAITLLQKALRDQGLVLAGLVLRLVCGMLHSRVDSFCVCGGGPRDLVQALDRVEDPLALGLARLWLLGLRRDSSCLLWLQSPELMVAGLIFRLILTPGKLQLLALALVIAALGRVVPILQRIIVHVV